jgi:hypothetical protein
VLGDPNFAKWLAASAVVETELFKIGEFATEDAKSHCVRPRFLAIDNPPNAAIGVTLLLVAAVHPKGLPRLKGARRNGWRVRQEREFRIFVSSRHVFFSVFPNQQLGEYPTPTIKASENIGEHNNSFMGIDWHCQNCQNCQSHLNMRQIVAFPRSIGSFVRRLAEAK